MANKWEFLKANGIYIYPSANADDGGDVNSELNVSGISRHLMQKGFIICDPKESPKPLAVSVHQNTSQQDVIRVRGGSIILEGYYIELFSKQSEYIILDKTIDESYISDAQGFLTEYNRVFQGLDKDGVKVSNGYRMTTTGHIEPVPYQKGNPPEELPTIHLIIKLIKDITGNVRGDLLERDASGNTTLKCKGCCWTFITSYELENLNVPYIDVAQIYPVPSNNAVPIKIYDVVTPPDAYSYIYIDSIYDENGDPLSTAIENRIKEGTKSLPKITHYQYPEGADGPRFKDLEISVESGVPKVIYYVKADPEQFDKDGDYVVVPITSGTSYYDKNYSIDKLQQRTHPASRQGYTPSDEENKIAKTIDANDHGNGTYTLSQATEAGYYPSNVQNGRSPLLARVDHSHDDRYLVKTQNDFIVTQEVYTNVKFNRNFEVMGTLKDGRFVVSNNGDIDNGIIKTIYDNKDNTTLPANYAVQVTGSVNVNGYIAAEKVYNAVWNDYAELYKKDDESINYEEGTVICKVRNKNTYSASDYSRNKLVVGVVTNSYGHLLGGDLNLSLDDNLKKYIPVSLAGRVPVKVESGKPIEEGDLLVVSIVKGRATTVAYPEPGTIIGKALESSTGNKDKILMQVMLG